MSQIQFQNQVFKALFLSIAAAAILVMVPADAAFAIGNAANNIGNKICDIATSVTTGNVGKGIATLAIVTIGIAACFGRASWTQALVIAIGVAVIGAAATIATGIGGLGC